MSALEILGTVAGALVALFYLTLLHFAAVMNLVRVRDAGQLTPVMTLSGYVMLYIGLVLDFLFNVTWGCMLFLEVPKEPLFSGRVTRLVGAGRPMGFDMPATLLTVLVLPAAAVFVDSGLMLFVSVSVVVVAEALDAVHGWRSKLALWVRKNFLDNIDPRGVHNG